MGSVLVAYATRNGSTQQVAQAVAEALREQGHTVDVQRARAARDGVGGRDFVVLGAPLYSGRWHRDAHRFLKRHRRHLPPVAVFGMGPRSDDAEAWSSSRSQLDRALAKHNGLAPVSVALFGGVDPPGKAAARDLRDWAAIATWARHLADRAGIRSS
jgi:menaquinone-dependent protoporphyrinogen oxidase